MNCVKRSWIQVVLTITVLLISGLVVGANTNNTKPLPADAAPPSEQILYKYMEMPNGRYLDYMKTVYNRVGTPQMIQEPLARFNKDLELLPAAARDWEVSEDGLTWTFHLRDLRWSDGHPLTAEDFAFALERAVTEGYDFSWYYSWAADIKNWKPVATGEKPLEELGVAAVDEKTLKVTTNEPKPYLPKIFTSYYPVPKHAVEKYGKEYATTAEKTVCSGPFKVEEWKKGEYITYVANPFYKGIWKPYLKKVKAIYGTYDAMTGFPAYMAGDIAMTYLNPGQLAYAKQAIPDQLVSYSRFSIHYLSFDANKEPFVDPKVRRAWSLAIDRKLMCSTVLKGLATPATTLVMPGFPGFNKNLTDIQKYNPEKAKKLLAEAGYPNGKGFPKTTIWLRNNPPDMAWQKPAANFVRSQLKKNLGITMDIRIVEMKTWMDAMNEKKHNLFFGIYSVDYIDPSNWMSLFITGGRHGWSNSQYDKLVKEANSSFKWEKRVKLYEKAEKILLEDPGFVPLYNTTVNQAWKPYLKGEAVEPDPSCLYCGPSNRGKQPITRTYFLTHLYIGKEK